MIFKLSERLLRVAPPPVESLNARRRALEAEGRTILDLGQAIPDLVVPPEALDALASALGLPETHRYTADPGLPALREAIAGWRAPGGGLDPAEVMVTAGANHAFLLVGAALLDPGDAVILPSPAFLNHRMTLDALGARVVDLPGKPRCALDLEALAERIRASGARMVVLCNPSNPTGQVLSRPELEGALAACREAGAWLVVDEVYADLVHPPTVFTHVHELPGAAEHSVSLWSFSKSFGMTGWRVGALRAPSRLYPSLVKVMDLSLICAPRASQLLALACLERCPAFPRQQVGRYVARQARVHGRLSGRTDLELWPGQAAFFTWFRPLRGGGSAQMCQSLLDEASLCLVPGAAFGERWDAWLRLSFGVVDEPRLIEALDRLERWLDQGEAGPS